MTDHCPHCKRPLHGLGTYCWECDNPVEMRQPVKAGAPTKRRKDTRSEKQIQQAIRLRWESHGATVLNLSQPRATKQTPGLPDQLIMIPDGGCVFCEVKTPTGTQSEYQKEVEYLCGLAGVPYLLARHEDDVDVFLASRVK